jgi:hypothetical protein
MKAGRRKWVTRTSKHQQVTEVPPREESAPAQPSPCAWWGDPLGEA